MVGITREGCVGGRGAGVGVAAVRDGAGAWLSPPAPVADAVQGVSGDPCRSRAGQVTVVVDDALSIVKVSESELPVWFSSPA